jgi:hypothetical protein
MLYLRICLILAIPVIIWIVIKLLKSPKYDKWCKNLTSGKLDTDVASKDAMKNISKAETDLGKQAETNIKEAEKLSKETDGIKDFLGKRGVVEVTEVAKEDKEVSE